MYDDNRYEVECKYTQAVAVHSRPVTARLDLAPLARALNRLEDAALLDPVRGYAAAAFRCFCCPALRHALAACILGACRLFLHLCVFLSVLARPLSCDCAILTPTPTTAKPATTNANRNRSSPGAPRASPTAARSCASTPKGAP